MTTIAEIKARLQADGTPFRLVQGAAELAAVKTMPPATPAAFVLAAKESTAENSRATGRILQRQERDIMVVIVTRNVADKRGDAAADELEDVIKPFVRAQLIGFVPTDMEEPITHVGGEIVEVADGAVWFEDTYSAPIYLRSAS